MSRDFTLDPGTRVFSDAETLVGGDPPRALRLTSAGARVARQLLSSGVADSSPAATLLQRLVRAGIAHPQPRKDSISAVTVVIPVRDRPQQLQRCLTALGHGAVDGAQITHKETIVVDDGSVNGDEIAVVCDRLGVALLTRATSGGPGAARNTALASASGELIAFVDSDCIPTEGWLELLCGALHDPKVGAAAPRIKPIDQAHGSATSRYAQARSPLDMGVRPGELRAGGRVSYVPTAALLVRASAIAQGFDETLRYGEDVDFVWRLLDAGWAIRYEPAAIVQHPEPGTLQALLRRRFAYGSSAGPLSLRHPDRLFPVRLYPLPAAVIVLVLAGSRQLAAGAAAVHIARTVQTLGTYGIPAPHAALLAVRGISSSTVAVGRAATMLAPGLLVAGLLHRRCRPASIGLLLAEPVRSWVSLRPSLDPVRWTTLAVADDVSYGLGVWVGAIRSRTLAPLTPQVTLKRFAAFGQVRKKRERPASDRESAHPVVNGS